MKLLALTFIGVFSVLLGHESSAQEPPNKRQLYKIQERIVVRRIGRPPAQPQPALQSYRQHRLERQPSRPTVIEQPQRPRIDTRLRRPEPQPSKTVDKPQQKQNAPQPQPQPQAPKTAANSGSAPPQKTTIRRIGGPYTGARGYDGRPIATTVALTAKQCAGADASTDWCKARQKYIDDRNKHAAEMEAWKKKKASIDAQNVAIDRENAANEAKVQQQNARAAEALAKATPPCSGNVCTLKQPLPTGNIAEKRPNVAPPPPPPSAPAAPTILSTAPPGVAPSNSTPPNTTASNTPTGALNSGRQLGNLESGPMPSPSDIARSTEKASSTEKDRQPPLSLSDSRSNDRGRNTADNRPENSGGKLQTATQNTGRPSPAAERSTSADTSTERSSSLPSSASGSAERPAANNRTATTPPDRPPPSDRAAPVAVDRQPPPASSSNAPIGPTAAIGAAMVPGNAPRIAPPAAASASWRHNSSEMQVVVEPQDPNTLRILYDKPRSGLSPLGIKSGTMLFNGIRNGDTVAGRATTFSRRCEPKEFAVSGRVINDTRVVLQGLKPTRNDDCDVVGSVEETLEFDLINR